MYGEIGQFCIAPACCIHITELILVPLPRRPEKYPGNREDCKHGME